MRGVIQLGIIVFTIALGIVVGNRLSSEAMAVVVGVVCGVLASIPTSIMILLLTRRMNRPAQSSDRAVQHSPYPPVIVIQPDNRRHNYQPELPWNTTVTDHHFQRSFTVMGEDDWEAETSLERGEVQ